MSKNQSPIETQIIPLDTEPSEEAIFTAAVHAAERATDIDNVNHPPHYKAHPSGVECIQITEHMNFNIGSAVKYLWRFGLKPVAGADELTDLRKARWYVDREIERLTELNGHG